MSENCANCRFGLKDGNNKVLCRFNPPAILVHQYVAQEAERTPPAIFSDRRVTLPQAPGFVIMAAATSAHFPPMQDNGWCGQHKPRE